MYGSEERNPSIFSFTFVKDRQALWLTVCLNSCKLAMNLHYGCNLHTCSRRQSAGTEVNELQQGSFCQHCNNMRTLKRKVTPIKALPQSDERIIVDVTILASNYYQMHGLSIFSQQKIVKKEASKTRNAV